MGATKHIHPISLHVIRGAAEYCGWKFGKIKQTFYHSAINAAVYLCIIDRLPRSADEWPLDTICKQLQHCFMDDITVKSVWRNEAGVWFARLIVKIDGPSDTELEAAQIESTAL